MICQISGVVETLSDNTLHLKVSGLGYEVYIPTAVLKAMEHTLNKGSEVSLVTYHYYQTDPSKSIPILIGFSNRLEKDFFEKFITVSGVGPKAAVRALSQPIPDIAQAIDGADLKFLKSLPGIGEQRAKEIIAKLQGKMERFSLIQKSPNSITGNVKTKEGSVASEMYEDAIEVLVQLQYKRDEAKRMLDKALSRKTKFDGIEDLLNEVYRQKKVD